MKSKLIWITTLAAAVACGALFSATTQPVNWQYDRMRETIARRNAEEALAVEFNRTNTDQRRFAVVSLPSFDWHPKKGEIELGYRNDGVVVWRELPEGR